MSIFLPIKEVLLNGLEETKKRLRLIQIQTTILAVIGQQAI